MIGLSFGLPPPAVDAAATTAQFESGLAAVAPMTKKAGTGKEDRRAGDERRQKRAEDAILIKSLQMGGQTKDSIAHDPYGTDDQCPQQPAPPRANPIRR